MATDDIQNTTAPEPTPVEQTALSAPVDPERDDEEGVDELYGLTMAGQMSAHELMTMVGLPMACQLFLEQAPKSRDPEDVEHSGRPIEFWDAMHDELNSVAGTA